MQPEYPFISTDLAGISGIIKHCCEDFQVEEIPAYEPTGEGEHLFLWIEKRNLSAEQLLRQLARDFNISRSEIGMAGLKDRYAITRQYISVPVKCEERISLQNNDSFQILHAKRHSNKLKTGHLRGNRFSILVRDVTEEFLHRCEQIAMEVNRSGFPNYFGRQRFGNSNENMQLGLKLLRGEITSKELPAKRRRFLLRMALSSVQSHLFNVYLANRIQTENIHKIYAGDVMQVLASGGKFVVDNVSIETKRHENGEIGITGPMFGPKMHRPSGQPSEWEQRVLNSEDLTQEQFGQFPKLTAGTRRLLMIKPDELCFQQEAEGLRFQFTLPPGCYATSLLREFMKTDV